MPSLRCVLFVACSFLLADADAGCTCIMVNCRVCLEIHWQGKAFKCPTDTGSVKVGTEQCQTWLPVWKWPRVRMGKISVSRPISRKFAQDDGVDLLYPVNPRLRNSLELRAEHLQALDMIENAIAAVESKKEYHCEFRRKSGSIIARYQPEDSCR